MQNCRSKLAQPGSFCRDGAVNFYAFLRRNNTNDHLKLLSRSQNAFSIEGSEFASTTELGTACSAFGLKPLHNLQLGVSKLSKDTISKFLASDRVVMESSGVSEHRPPLSLMRVSIPPRVSCSLGQLNGTLGCQDHL